MAISGLLEITPEDIPIICNYLNDEAYNNGIRKNPKYISRVTTYDILDDEVSKYKICKDNDEIIAFLLYRVDINDFRNNELLNYYIRPEYRSHRLVALPLARKLVEVFGDTNLSFKRLYPTVDSVTKYTVGDFINIEKLSKYLKRLEKYK